jgi:hypothetical protein
VDVRLQHDLLVLLGRVAEGVAAEREPGVVDEDVEPAAELRDRLLDEALAARAVGDVERERDLGRELVAPPRPSAPPRSPRRSRSTRR